MIFSVFATGTAWLAGQTIVSHDFLSGWVLFGGVLFLTAYNVRKAVPFLPLGTSSQWLQCHIYVGLFSFVLFLIHIDYRLPNGLFESVLAGAFLILFCSGLWGLYITRSYPKRLTNLGREIIYEQIPAARKRLQDQIESLILDCAEEIEGSELPAFYRGNLSAFVMRRPDWLRHLLSGHSRYWRDIQRKMSDAERFLNEEEIRFFREIEKAIHRKHQLDTQEALQAALKMWLFVHIPMTYAFLTFAACHIVLVYAWSGGAL